MAFVAETVVGATAGAVPPVAGLFQAHPRDLRPPRRAADPRRGDVRHGPHRHAACLRAGRHRARPMTIAKGLGGGYQPIGAVLLGRHDLRSLRERHRLLPARPHLYGPSHGLRRGARGAGDRSAATICWPTCARMGALLRRRLGERFGNHPHVGDIRGRGLFQAIELVEDRATKTPFDPAQKLHARVKKAAMARGLMVYPMGGTIDGSAATMSCWRRPSSSRRGRSARSSIASAAPSTTRWRKRRRHTGPPTSSPSGMQRACRPRASRRPWHTVVL